MFNTIKSQVRFNIEKAVRSTYIGTYSESEPDRDLIKRINHKFVDIALIDTHDAIIEHFQVPRFMHPVRIL
jgi:hypothetical protein